MAISRLQETRNAPGTDATSRAVTVTATGTGNLLIVVVTTGSSSTVTHNAPTDNATGGSNTYVQIGTTVSQVDGSAHVDLSVWKCLSSRAGATTVTATLGADPGNFLDVYFAEYLLSGATWTQNSTNQNTGNSTTASSGAFTSAAADLLFGAALCGTASATNLVNLLDTTDGNGIGDTLSATGGSTTVTFTTTSGDWCCLGASFTATVGGNPAPTLTAISPIAGTVNGGTSTSLTGTGLLSGATVSFGGTAATGVSVNSGVNITCTSPAALLIGPVSIVVTNTDAQAATLTNAYTYWKLATQASQRIGIFSKDAVLAVGVFDTGIPTAYGLYDDDFVAQFSGTASPIFTDSMTGSVPWGVFDRKATLIGLLGAI